MDTEPKIVQDALKAAKAGDRETFDRLWNQMTRKERWAMHAHARIASIKKACGHGF